MNFYEFYDPYYALIKAIDEEQAVQTYIDQVAGRQDEFDDLLEECEPIYSDYAISRFAQCKCEDGNLMTIADILKTLRSDQAGVLVIDGSLI
ncbi:hypothetical protein ACQKNB_01000 [Lysinibacillus xylanilyticus]|uniref:hypothetical protein n=1 Tax=Lysinibacillus xylanilyticus TaxID=582475 RepID=UPI003D018963